MIQINVKGKYKENYNIAHLTWFKVGGNADIFFKPVDLNDLIVFLKQIPLDYPITLVGAGSNLLIRDKGIQGAVIQLVKNFAKIKILSNNRLAVGAGCLNYNLAKFALDNSIQGFEFLVGIPGTIGGGVAMNAGAHGSEFKDIVLSVEAVDHSGKVKIFTLDDIGFGYRKNSLAKNLIFTKVIFQYKSGQQQKILKKIDKIQTQRINTQPITSKTAGSSFTNPNGHNAWKLIDQAGCRNLKVGGAKISNLHCNFIINTGTASAQDIETLGNLIQAKVYESCGIKLEWEIKIIGKK